MVAASDTSLHELISGLYTNNRSRRPRRLNPMETALPFPEKRFTPSLLRFASADRPFCVPELRSELGPG